MNPFSFTAELFGHLYPARIHWRSSTLVTLHMIRISLPIVVLSSVFVGAILVVMFAQHVQFFRAESVLGAFATSGLLREVGPLLVGFLLSGQCGAYVASEISTMKSTDQLDTLQSLGLSDMDLILVPRCIGIFLACTFALSVSLASGIAGAFGVGALFYGMSLDFFFAQFHRVVEWSALGSGVYKCVCFGAAISWMSCYTSYTAPKSTFAVSRTVQKTALRSMLALIVIDMLTTHTFRWFMAFIGA